MQRWTGWGKEKIVFLLLLQFVLFCFVSFDFSRALSTSRKKKKKGCGQVNKKSFSSSDLV